MRSVFAFMKSASADFAMLVFYVIIIFLPSALIVGACNKLIEQHIDRHKLL